MALDEFENRRANSVERRAAERVVENWNRDQPDCAGDLHVEPIEFALSSD